MAKIDMISMLAEDKRIITYRPNLRPVCGSVTGIIMLQQIIYWWEKSGRAPFYKFKEPCGHKLYRNGNSWTEELGFSKAEVNGALNRIAVKINSKMIKDGFINNKKPIEYFIDISRITYYQINEPVLLKLIENAGCYSNK